MSRAISLHLEINIILFNFAIVLSKKKTKKYVSRPLYFSSTSYAASHIAIDIDR